MMHAQRSVIVTAATVCLVTMAGGAVWAQTSEAYDTKKTETVTGLLDPSRFSLNHSLSFGMMGSSTSNVKSQSLYSTMMRYDFVAPVTLNLNFSMPIHSTFNSGSNLTSENIESAEYFRNMPVAASLTWQPRDNLLMRFSVVRDPRAYSYRQYTPLERSFMRSAW